MHVAYLVNLYPTVSHTFIRREIHALEAEGVEVIRLALRGWDSELVDPLDLAELDKTRHTLRHGIKGLAMSTVRVLLRRPWAFARALKLALRMSRNHERSWPFHLIYLAHACRILTWLKKSDVTHIHAHFGTNPAEIACLIKALGGPRYSFTIHGKEFLDDPKHQALPIKVEHAEFVAASCAYIASQIMYHTPYALWQKVEVVRCGLAKSRFAAPATPPSDAPVFLSVGRFSPEKGHFVLLDAFAEVHARIPEARLVLAGDGPMRAQIEARIAKFGLAKSVRLAGWVTSDQVQQELQGARALVHPSFTEGLPVVIMEAMAGRRPVISTYIAGIPELVRDGETGWLVPAGQVAPLVEAMCACADMSQSEISQFAEAGFDRVQRMHDVTTEAARLRGKFQTRLGD